MNIDDIRACIATASAELSSRKEEINRLNVFPVPDGDTGTNMSLTMESVAREVAALPPNADGAALRKAVTHGSLMGARGIPASSPVRSCVACARGLPMSPNSAPRRSRTQWPVPSRSPSRLSESR